MVLLDAPQVDDDLVSCSTYSSCFSSTTIASLNQCLNGGTHGEYGVIVMKIARVRGGGGGGGGKLVDGSSLRYRDNEEIHGNRRTYDTTTTVLFSTCSGPSCKRKDVHKTP